MTSLYDIYTQQGKALPKTVDERFADPNFASAAQTAGITKDQYAVNSQNASLNTRIANAYKILPATPENSVVKPTTPPVTPAIVYKDLTNVPTGTFESSDTISARKAQGDYLSTLTAPNETDINNNQLARIQAQIDATNDLYASELSRARQLGAGRIGTQTAISARRGLIGSDFGESQAQTQEFANEDVYKSIERERLAKVNALLTGAKDDASAEIARKREEFTKGLDARVAYYSQADERKTTNSSKAIAALIAQGINPKDVNPAQLKQLATYYGISTDDIVAGYDSQKKADDLLEKSKIKNSQPSSVQEYEYAKIAGYTGSFTEYQNEDANRKAVISGQALTPYQKFQATQSISKDTQARTDASREILRQSNLIKSSYENILNGGDRSLNTQAIIVSFNKVLDPTSVVRESEYDRTAAGQALIERLRGKVDNITAGGAGVTQETLREASDIAQKYLDNANKTIQAENDRARKLAESFGLNSDFVGSVGSSPQGVSTTPTVTAKGGISF